MNELIKDCFIKAYGYVPLPIEENIPIEMEKFAELIVQECTRYINNDYTRDFDILWREDLTSNINKHFGVKE
jgi:hypothetical protein